LPIPRVLAIGASTGRPQALSLFLGRLSPHLDNVPVLIVLHMPPDFTDVVCGHIERATGRPTHAARNSERIRPGEIYFAPGNRHLKAAKLDTTPILLHCDSAPENFCRPAVNVLFRSVAQVYGPGTLAIVLPEWAATVAKAHARWSKPAARLSRRIVRPASSGEWPARSSETGSPPQLFRSIRWPRKWLLC
jgi:two-component system chemotaxis response regulator CheB